MASEPGAAAEGYIPLAVPEIRGNEWRYVKDCLDTNWVSSVGPYVDRFEQMLAQYVGTNHAVATVNGTAALHVALLVAGVKPNDEVLVSTLSFIAPANAVRYAGAWPVFIDAEQTYFQMDAERVRQFIEEQCDWREGALVNRTTGRSVTAIIPVHILGHPVDMDPILELAEKFGLAVVEDATESLGSFYKGRRTGALGHIGCFSFNGNKIITTGGGGMLVTDNADWARRAKHLTTQAKLDPVEYVHDEIGYNYRLTNVQAAVGCAQMEELDDFISIKRGLAQKYSLGFSSVPGIKTQLEASWAHSICWLNTILVDADMYGEDSRALMKRLDKSRIQARPLWQPLHQSLAHRDAQVIGGGVAERLNRQALSLPSSVGLNDEDQQVVIDAIRERPNKS
jgi:perosamine synthetase